MLITDSDFRYMKSYFEKYYCSSWFLTFHYRDNNLMGSHVSIIYLQQFSPYGQSCFNYKINSAKLSIICQHSSFSQWAFSFLHFVQMKIQVKFHILQLVDMILTSLFIYRICTASSSCNFFVQEIKLFVTYSLQLSVLCWLFTWGIFKHVALSLYFL